jgi:hypothetical protein
VQKQISTGHLKDSEFLLATVDFRHTPLPRRLVPRTQPKHLILWKKTFHGIDHSPRPEPQYGSCIDSPRSKYRDGFTIACRILTLLDVSAILHDISNGWWHAVRHIFPKERESTTIAQGSEFQSTNQRRKLLTKITVASSNCLHAPKK